MKYYKYLYVLLTLVLVSCSDEFLDRDYSDNPGINFLKGGDKNAIQLTNAAYASLQKNGLYCRMVTQVNESRSDIARITKNTPKMEEDLVAAVTFTNNSGGKTGEMIWRDSYNGILRSNVVIENVSDNQNVSPELRSRLLGEAYFLRALYYFHVTMYFGNRIAKTVEANNSYPYPFETETEVWELMIDDLKTSQENFAAIDYTNETWQTEDIGRANLGAATGMLGKVYLFYAQIHHNNSTEYLNLAKAEFLKVYNQQVGSYALENNFMDNFRNYNEYNNESLFEISFADFGFKTWEIDQDNAGAVETHRVTKNSTVCDGVGEMWWNQAPTTRIKHEFETDDAGEVVDYRYYYTLWTPDGAYFNNTRIDADGNMVDSVYTFYDMPWPGKNNAPSTTKWGSQYNDYMFYGFRKYGFDYNFWVKDNICSDHVGSDINIRYLRYSDVLLMLAECEYYTGGDATKYINEVRLRANHKLSAEDDPSQSTWGNNNLPYLNQEGALPLIENSAYASNIPAAIQHERMVELAGEGHRYFDIIRWSKAGELIDLREPGFPKASASDVVIDPGFTGDFLFPIPQVELSANPNMIPNSAN